MSLSVEAFGNSILKCVLMETVNNVED